MRVPMSSPDIGRVEIDLVTEVLNSGQLSMGPKLAAFEEAVCGLTGVRHGCGVSSGTAGLHLMMLAAGVRQGDLVVTTPYSFVASSNCILYQRAIPVFVDVEPVTGNINAAEMEQTLHDLARGGAVAERRLPRKFRHQIKGIGDRLRAVLAVHVFGQPAEMDAICAIARARQLAVLEDACEAIGACYKSRPAGSLGDSAVFAFYPNKQIATGEGGMIVTDRGDWANLFRSLRNQGRDQLDGWLNHSRLGFNYRLDELSSALGLAQIGRLEELLARRSRVAAWYTERLTGLDWLLLPRIAATTTRMSWFVFVVRLDPRMDRTLLMGEMAAAGIPSRPYFTPISLLPYYRQRFGYQNGDFAVAEALGETSLALPFSSVMTESEVDLVCVELIRLARKLPLKKLSSGCAA